MSENESIRPAGEPAEQPVPQPPAAQPAPPQPPYGVPGQETYGVPGQEQYHGVTPPFPPAPSAGGNRLGKAVALGAAAVVLALTSGTLGAVAAIGLAGADFIGVNKTYQAAPAVDRSSLSDIAGQVQPSVVSIRTGSGEGSGVVLSQDGYVLTNSHVVATGSGNGLTVVFSSGKSARASVVGSDPRSDLAVVKAQGVSGLTPARFGDSEAMRVGDTVLALGSPLGLDGSVTAGIVSALDRTIQPDADRPAGRSTPISGLLQTDAAINPGNSGGALVNLQGEVIGINTAIATSGGGNGNIGVGFAIPSNRAKQVADQLRKGEKVQHAFLGVSVRAADGGGAVVATVQPGSPAATAGLQQGDVVTRFGDTVINDSDDLVTAVQARRVGDRVEITYLRNGVEKTATATLTEAS